MLSIPPDVPTCGWGCSLLQRTANREPSLQSRPTSHRRSLSLLRAETQLRGAKGEESEKEERVRVWPWEDMPCQVKTMRIAKPCLHDIAETRGRMTTHLKMGCHKGSSKDACVGNMMRTTPCQEGRHTTAQLSSDHRRTTANVPSELCYQSEFFGHNIPGSPL